MKKLILAITGIILSTASFSQLSIGVQATGALADAKFKTGNDIDYTKKMRAMPGAGVVLQYAVSEHLAVRSGLNYVQNGSKLNATVTVPANMHVELKNTLHYVQVPVNVLYTVPFSGIQFFAGGGGYISYGISGKSKSTLTTVQNGHDVVTTDEQDAFKKEENGGVGLKRADVGISALAGVRFGRALFANIGYQLSLSNIDKNDGDASYKNRSLQLTIGYFFR